MTLLWVNGLTMGRSHGVFPTARHLRRQLADSCKPRHYWARHLDT